MGEQLFNAELGPQITGGGVALAKQVFVGDTFTAAEQPPINPPGPTQPRIPRPTPEKPGGPPYPPAPTNPPSRA